MPKPRPSELEMQVLGVLWEQGAMTVRDILGRLPDGKERAYTTVLTVLQGMEKKGFVSHTRGESLAHIYQPEVTHEEIVQPLLKTFLKNLFAGDPSRVVQALVDSTDISQADLKQIRRVINQASKDAERRENES